MVKSKKTKAKKEMVIKKPAAKTKKKTAKTVPSGIVHVKATFNNTIISITDTSGNSAMNYGMKEVEVCLKGPGAGRESAVRGIQSTGLIITLIKDKTPIPHNGCRPRKRRRV